MNLFGSASGGCVPDAKIEVQPYQFAASEIWNANKKLGQSVAFDACNDVLNWQTSMASAKSVLTTRSIISGAVATSWTLRCRGYIAYTNCTSLLAEVVPFGGNFPTLGNQSAQLGIPNSRCHWIPHRYRLGNFGGGHGACATV